MELKKALHIFVSPLLNETRLFKEVDELLENNHFERIYALGIWDLGLKSVEIHESGLVILRVKTISKKYKRWDSNSKSILKSIFAYLSLIQYSFAVMGISIRLRIGYITCHNVLLLPVAVINKILTRAKLVYAPHELESKRSGVSKKVNTLSYLIEKTFLRYCNDLVVVSDPIAKWYKDQYKLVRVHIVRALPKNDSHFYGLEYLQTQRNNKRAEYGLNTDDIVFIYQGLMSKSRGIEDMVDVFKNIKGNRYLCLMGYGDIYNSVASQSYRNIKCINAVKYNQIVLNTCMADIGLHVIPGEVSISYKYSLPNKFYEYIHSHIPIIVSSNLEHISEIVKMNDIGWVIEAEEFQKMINQISKDDIQKKKNNVIKYAYRNRWQSEKSVYYSIYR